MRHGFNSWGGKIPWRRKWQPTPVFLSMDNPMDGGAGQATVSWGHKELDETEVTQHTCITHRAPPSCWMFFNEQLLVSFVGVSLLSLNENIAKWKPLLSSNNRHVTLKKKRWPHILVFYQGGPARPKLCLPSALVCFSIPKQNTGISRGKKFQKSRFLGESCKVDYYHKKRMATQINKGYIQTRLGVAWIAPSQEILVAWSSPDYFENEVY